MQVARQSIRTCSLQTVCTLGLVIAVPVVATEIDMLHDDAALLQSIGAVVRTTSVEHLGLNNTSQHARGYFRRPLTHAYCKRAFRDKRHVFHGMWSEHGALPDGFFSLSGQQYIEMCWDGVGMTKSEYFEAVKDGNMAGYSCIRNWNSPAIAPAFAGGTAMILGKDSDIDRACGSPVGCSAKGMHRLNLGGAHGIGHWNMCRNFEFVACGAMGALEKQSGALVYFATGPHDLWPEDVVAEPQWNWDVGDSQYWGSRVIYLIEMCLLDKLCANRRELWSTRAGNFFTCVFDERGLEELMLEL